MSTRPSKKSPARLRVKSCLRIVEMLLLVVWPAPSALGQMDNVEKLTLLSTQWNDSQVTIAERHSADARLRKAVKANTFRSAFEGSDLCGLADVSITVEFLDAALSTLSDEECFFVCRNLVPRLLIADIDNLKLHRILSRLIQHDSKAVRAQTYIALREAPLEVTSNSQVCSILIEGIRKCLELRDGEGESARRLVYRLRSDHCRDKTMMELATKAVDMIDFDAGIELIRL